MKSHWTLRPVQAQHCFRLALNSVNRHCAIKQAFLLSRGCKDSRTFARQVSMDDCDNLKDAKAVCAPLLDDSIFNQCRCQVDPMPFYMNCLYDMVYSRPMILVTKSCIKAVRHLLWNTVSKHG